MSELYEPFVPVGYPAWFTLQDNEADLQRWYELRDRMQAQMTREGAHSASGEVDSEEIENQFFEPVSEWLISVQPVMNGMRSEENGFRVVLDFADEQAQRSFLLAFPNWTKEKPFMWWDIPGVPVTEALDNDKDGCSR